MENSPRYPWRQTVLEAYLSSREELPAKISAAEKAIAARLRETDQADLEERIALNDGLRALQILMNEVQPHSARAPSQDGKKDTA